MTGVPAFHAGKFQPIHSSCVTRHPEVRKRAAGHRGPAATNTTFLTEPPMKAILKTNPARCGLPRALAFTCAFASIGLPAGAAFTLTNTNRVALAASQVEAGGDTSPNPELTGGLGGPLLDYTSSSLTGSFPLADYATSRLNDGDIGAGVSSSGLYAITNTGEGSLILDFGASMTLSGIAVYNGYANRDNGSYLLKDGGGNILGGWSIATPQISGGTNDGMDSFWLTFTTPVTTGRLVFDTVASDPSSEPVLTLSYREIQVFGVPAASISAVPEPSGQLALLALGSAGILTRRRTKRAA